MPLLLIGWNKPSNGRGLCIGIAKPKELCQSTTRPRVTSIASRSTPSFPDSKTWWICVRFQLQLFAKCFWKQQRHPNFAAKATFLILQSHLSNRTYVSTHMQKSQNMFLETSAIEAWNHCLNDFACCSSIIREPQPHQIISKSKRFSVSTYSADPKETTNYGVQKRSLGSLNKTCQQMQTNAAQSKRLVWYEHRISRTNIDLVIVFAGVCTTCTQQHDWPMEN